jgi:hypothetical protein
LRRLQAFMGRKMARPEAGPKVLVMVGVSQKKTSGNCGDPVNASLIARALVSAA